MNKTVIAPLVTLLALLIKSAFHIELSNELQDGLVTGLLAVYTAYGVWKNHKKEGAK
jgi:uncharacterized protein (DUF697 family)